MMLKFFFLSLFQACFLLAAPGGISETENNPASPILPQDINGKIENALREAMTIPKATLEEARLWIEKINQIANRFMAQITLIKDTGDRRIFRTGNPRLIRIVSFNTPDFKIEFDN